MERARWTCLFYYWPNANLYVPVETFGEPLQWTYKNQYIKWYLDSKCLFMPSPKRSIVWIACVTEEWTDSSQFGIIFFQTIDLLLLPYFEWLNIMDSMLSTCMRMSIEHWVCGTRVIQQNFVTQQIKVLTLRLLLSLFHLCGHMKRSTPLKLRNIRRMWIPS